MRVLFAAPARLWADWAAPLHAACPEMALLRDGPPDSLDALIYAPGYPEDGTPPDFSPFTRARLVQSLWAGVERIVGNETLTQPLCRMVDPGLQQGMVEYCLGWAMRAHLGMDRYLQDGVWRNEITPPLAAQRRVTVLGTGALGGAVAHALCGLGFDVAAWSRSGHPIEGAADLPVMGGDKLDGALARAEILISLLPDTPGTRGLLNALTLSLLPPGATLINPGRGSVLVEGDLLAALDDGHIGMAVLDVFATEPLPPAHPFWTHPRVVVTPHIAAETRPATAAVVVAENLRRAMDGRPLLHQVNRDRGY